MSDLKISNLFKSFPGMDRPAVNNVDLEIKTGELVAFLGPSGCGKTTILKMITGLFQPDSGDITLDNESLLPIATEKRGVVMVFQNYLLFPYMNVNENVGFALKMKGIAKDEIDKKVKDMLELVKLPDIGDRKPKQLSGGQQQRVALARALISKPKLLLLDEPLSNLDAHLRDEMRELIVTIQQKLDVTTVFVTHDQEEAVLLADKVALIFDGELQSYASPIEYYESPTNERAARFFGGVNFLQATINKSNVDTEIGPIKYTQKNKNDLLNNHQLTIRPENIEISKTNIFKENYFSGIVSSIIFSGTSTRYKIRIKDTTLDCSVPSVGIKEISKNDEVFIHLPADKIWGMND
jgi:ABC-type Fe3+/spermidine/putrescine transport system ATPase subunit|tara:strand:+ start:1365 stop:2420 length:1056 start_codon:yes stop_codon:yes gene_type:complete